MRGGCGQGGVCAVMRLIVRSENAAPILGDLLRDKVHRGGPTAYVCRGFHCEAPVHDATALVQQLA